MLVSFKVAPKEFISLIRPNRRVVGIGLLIVGLSCASISLVAGSPSNASHINSKTHTHFAAENKKDVSTTQQTPTNQGAAASSNTYTAVSTQNSKTSTPVTNKPSSNATPQTNTVQTYVTSATVTILNGCAGSYKYTVGFYGSTRFTFSAQWEIVSGAADYNYGVIDTLPSAIPMAGSAFSASDSWIYDTKSPGLPIYTGYPYTARIHVTSPNDFYSNIVSIPDTCE
jgi:hypothetical protein